MYSYKPLMALLLMVIVGYVAAAFIGLAKEKAVDHVVDKVIELVPGDFTQEGLACIAFCGEYKAAYESKTIHIMENLKAGSRISWEGRCTRSSPGNALVMQCLFQPYSDVNISILPEEKLLREVTISGIAKEGDVIKVKGKVQHVNVLGIVVVVDKASNISVTAPYPAEVVP